MNPRQAAGSTARRSAALRRTPAAAVCLFVVQLVASPVWGLPTLEASDLAPRATVQFDTPQSTPMREDPDTALRVAVDLADEGELDKAASVLSDALDRWPDHPSLLAGLVGLRLRQGRPAEGERLAARLVQVDPAWDHGWALLAASRYLQDDTHGALRAWSHGRAPIVQEMDIRILGHDGPRASTSASRDPCRLTGLSESEPLTVESLVRGERRLGSLPAASRARLGYRILPDGAARIEGTVVLGATNPFTRPGVAAHALRILTRRIHIVSADPLGRLEHWELSGSAEGTLRSAAFSLAHPAPHGSGVWRWTADHGAGRYAPAAGDEIVHEQRTGIAWSHTNWITASLRGSARGRIDVRPERGTFAGFGMSWTLLSLTERGSIQAEAMGWTKVRGAAEGGNGSMAGRSEEATRFGRLALTASIRPPAPAGLAAPSGMALRGGVVTVSPGAPHDLLPRIGSGGNTSLLMRAGSDLDGSGVVRPLFPGRSWAHGGVEVLRAVATVGPVGLGVAAFADAIRVLAPDPGAAVPATRRGAVHLGVGARARIPGMDGWFRADWGFDPATRASRISAAWVSGGSP